MTEQVQDVHPRTADAIIDVATQKYTHSLDNAKTQYQKLVELKEKVSSGDLSSLNLVSIVATREDLMKSIKKTREVFFCNEGKMNYTGPASEVFGEFKMWHERKDKVQVIQDLLASSASVYKQSLVVIEELLTIVQQNKPQQPATVPEKTDV